MTNPYESPRSTTPAAAGPRYSALRLAFFVINLTAAAELLVICTIEIVTMDSVSGGLFFLVPVSLIGLAELNAFRRRDQRAERRLGWLNLCGAAFILIILVGAASQAIISDHPLTAYLLVGFTLIGGAVASYLALCGLCRLRWTREAATKDVHPQEPPEA